MTNNEVVTLKQYIDTKVESVSKLYETKVEAIEKATELAANQMNSRLEGMNEFRDALKDQNANFISRNEYETQLKTIEKNHNDRISILELHRERMQGKADQSSVNIAQIMSLLALLIGIAGLIVAIVIK